MKRKDRRHYVYIYSDLSGVPFYVGKGTGDRFRHHLRPNVKTWVGCKLRRIIDTEGYTPYPELIFVGTDKESLQLEKDLIAKFGREDLKTGTLCNLTDGGDGVGGHTKSETTKEKLRLANLGPNNPGWGKPLTDDHKRKLRAALLGEKSPKFGVPMPKEIREKISAVKKSQQRRETTEQRQRRSERVKGENHPLYGVGHREESRKKMSETKKGMKWPILTCPYCKRSGANNRFKGNHFEKCKEKGPEEPGQS